MIAASIADVDGVGFFFSEEAYWRFHHVVGHNLLFGLVACAALACFSQHCVKAFVVYLTVFHLHLWMDYWGSGPGWAIYYLWPFSNFRWRNPDSWEYASWQNAVVFGGLLMWTIGIAIARRRTPVEFIAPRLDRLLVPSLILPEGETIEPLARQKKGDAR